MRVRVLFFGLLKELAGRTTDSVELPTGATVADLLARCADTVPRLRDYFSSLAISVNEEYAVRSATLHDGDEVGLLPPVSGGSDAAIPEQRQRVSLVRSPIDAQAIIDGIKHPSDGAVAVFDGIVRDNTRGRRTLFLDYEAYEPMARKELDRLAGETLQRFDVRDVAIVHRLGRLQVNETSVLIAVAAAHRGAAFDACRWIIDTLKRTVPIWKKEHFEDGAVWADGEPFPEQLAARDERSGSR